ncbi:MAG: tRNA (adenosine(37)-N6)-threonylcarbamoyltransferase complex transferase subunit TsaD [Bacillota bacterium]|nr:tRNA (adenosine(37)-N6)-threonylcarbamoyltransferase complex transferase subunit TsaD [Bacillota bacterium]
MACAAGSRGLVLGIETSCDETAVAVVGRGTEQLSGVVASQVELHAKYGGIVPEVASRRHVEAIVPAAVEALDRAGVSGRDLVGLAVTNRPGLVGSLMVGLAFAKSLAFAWDLPFVAVDHVLAHVYASFLVEPRPRFPFLALVVSGGHTDLLVFENHDEHRVIGQTRDDAAGEAFDKVARLLGLGYPGGPAVDRLAPKGRPDAVDWPDPRLDDAQGRFDFSFSGLKTAVLYHLKRQEALGRGVCVPDIAASFQARVAASLAGAAFAAAKEHGLTRIVIAGGVAANSGLRREMVDRAARGGVQVFIPPIWLCTDNAAMVAAAGYVRLARGERDDLGTSVFSHS